MGGEEGIKLETYKKKGSFAFADSDCIQERADLSKKKNKSREREEGVNILLEKEPGIRARPHRMGGGVEEVVHSSPVKKKRGIWKKCSSGGGRVN